MGPWAWIAAYVVGFALLQLLLYRYVGRKTRGTTSPAAPDAPATPSVEHPTGGDETRTCDDCGAVNTRASGYRFCRECAARLC